MLKQNRISKKHALGTLVGGALLAMSASAHALLGLPLPTDIILTFEFVGEFTMTNPDGTVVPNTTPAISGTMMLDALTFGGTAAMTGTFLNKSFAADGAFSAYPDTLGVIPNMCNGAPMCAHSNINFLYSGYYHTVEAAFGMTPSQLFDLTNLTGLLNDGFYFDVVSLDTEPDGLLGTSMKDPHIYRKSDGLVADEIFGGFTPAFTGRATLINVALLQPEIANQGIYIAPVPAPVPEPAEWGMMLAGVGLVGAMAYRRRKSSQVAV
jgi:hypothetical protein